MVLSNQGLRAANLHGFKNERDMLNASNWTGLIGRTCVVAGATGGIGREVAKAFADAGANLVLLDFDRPALDELEARTSDAGVQVMTAVCDISDQLKVAEVAYESMNRMGPCAALINCAAIQKPGPLIDTTPEKWEAAFRINFGGALYLSQQYGRQMPDIPRTRLLLSMWLTRYIV